MSDIKDWRDGVESWLKERGIPSAPGMAVRELSGAVMKPSPQALEATLTILKAQSPITALWHELDFEGEGFSFRTQSGWETLVCSARLLEDATVGPADTDSDDLEDDDDEGEWLYQVEPEVAERAVSVLQPAHAEFL